MLKFPSIGVILVALFVTSVPAQALDQQAELGLNRLGRIHSAHLRHSSRSDVQSAKYGRSGNCVFIGKTVGTVSCWRK